MNVLQKHGTEFQRLTPGAILGAASADIKRRAHNRDLFLAPPYERYAFLAKHVRRCDTPEELIRAALSDIQGGLKSSKAATQLIYAHKDELVQIVARVE